MADEERPSENLGGGDEGDTAAEIRKITNYPLVKV